MKRYLLLLLILYSCDNQDIFHETSDNKLYFKNNGKLYLVENKLMTEVDELIELNEQLFSVVEDSIPGYGGLIFLGFIKYFNNSLNYTIKISSNESNVDTFYDELKSKSGSQFTIQFIDKLNFVIAEKSIYDGFTRDVDAEKLQYLNIHGSLNITLEQYLLVRGINVILLD